MSISLPRWAPDDNFYTPGAYSKTKTSNPASSLGWFALRGLNFVAVELGEGGPSCDQAFFLSGGFNVCDNQSNMPHRHICLRSCMRPSSVYQSYTFIAEYDMIPNSRASFEVSAVEVERELKNFSAILHE